MKIFEISRTLLLVTHATVRLYRFGSSFTDLFSFYFRLLTVFTATNNVSIALLEARAITEFRYDSKILELSKFFFLAS